jgi:multidrug efflux pump
MMGGIVGRLFREFAVTLSAAILISMIISLTTTPCMCAYVLRAHKEGEKQNIFSRTSEKAFDGLQWIYRKSLLWVLDNSLLMLIVFLLTVALNVVVILRIPTGIFPQQDTGLVMGMIQGPQDASFPLMNFSVQKLMQVVKADPAIAHANGYTGAGGGPGGGASNGGNIFIALKPLGTQCKENTKDSSGNFTCGVRQTSATDVINRLRPKMNALPVATAILQPVQDLRIGGRGSAAQYQYTVQADSVADLAHWGPILLAQMKKLPGLQDVNTDQQNGGLEELVNYDRTTAARLGQTSQSLDNALYAAFGQSEVSVIYTQLNQYYVVMEVAPPYWQDPSGLNNIYIKPGGSSTTGSTTAGLNLVTPLTSMMKASSNTTPLAVNHTGLFPSVTVSFNMANGMSLSDAVREVTEMEQQLGMPGTIKGFFAGTAQAYQDSLASEKYLVITALLAVFIVLGILYESLVHPITIISTLPSASVGAMLALMLFKMDLNVISIIGIILLIGIVKKNAIMMIDFALQAERNDGKNTRDSIFEACMLRFRPILMTTFSAIMGALPLAFGTGTGSELRRPLGITIVGGLLLSQLLTLYTTPVIYLMMDRMRLWALNREHSLQPSAAEGTAS